MARTHRIRGFSLLEVLLALVIFALAAVVLAAGYLNVINSYTAIGRGNFDSQDVAFARQAVLQQADLAMVQKGDDYETADGKRIKWTAAVEPTTVTDLFTVIFTCTISPSSGEAKTSEETFMLLRPTWSEPASRTTLRQSATDRIAKAQGKAPQ